MPRPPKSAAKNQASTATIGLQVVSENKGNRVALPGQLFYSTQIPVCLWFSRKIGPADKCCAVSELETELAA